ncbi:hypothetical protein G4B88_000326 [Cannabis sativa]|uniref:Uncharacterized protein n=1 Tax=Cannabis sativa TaxID=3483 RepID=A0A7J6DVD3_CANSA|nr:hypothetical protein G4B88_000326 [Cannabis sativa]
MPSSSSLISISTFLLQQMISSSNTPKLYTSTLTVIGMLLNHSGATYPFVPLMAVLNPILTPPTNKKLTNKEVPKRTEPTIIKTFRFLVIEEEEGFSRGKSDFLTLMKALASILSSTLPFVKVKEHEGIEKATVPGLNLCGFFTPPVAGADFLAALVASCFLGAFPPVDFLAVCLVRAIVEMKLKEKKSCLFLGKIESENGLVESIEFEFGIYICFVCYEDELLSVDLFSSNGGDSFCCFHADREKNILAVWNLTYDNPIHHWIQTQFYKQDKIQQILSSLASDSTSQLNILWHDRNSLSVDRTEISVFEETDQVSFGSFLKSRHSARLESKIGLEILSDFSDQSLEWKLADQKLGALLVLPDLSQGDGSWPESVWLLHSSGGWSGLSCCLGRQLLPWRLSSGGFSCGLLGTSHWGNEKGEEELFVSREN